MVRTATIPGFWWYDSVAKIVAVACMWTAIAVSSAGLASVSIGIAYNDCVGGIGTLTIVFAVRTVAEPKDFERGK